VTDIRARLAAALADRYRLERELGQGGMATVYLAEDVRHRRKVAIKVLHPELSAVIGGERFLKEIELTAALQHPHILPLFDSGSAEGLLFYVMPLVEGQTLRARLEHEKQLPVADAIRLAREVAGALDYAHRKGVVHRDIKPENVLLHDGTALVADFGIALAVSNAGAGRLTQTGLSLGTPHYMSPEQATGEREITPRADVYALGAMTYEMLTGEPPFLGTSAQAIVAKLLTEEPARILPRRKAVPPHVEDAVLTALEKLPADRFASAREFAEALGGASTTHRTPPTATAPMRAASRGAMRTRWPLAVAAVALAAVAFASAWIARRDPPSPARADLVTSDLVPPPGCEYRGAGVQVVQFSPDGGHLAFVADCARDVSLWVRDLATGGQRKLPGTAGAGFPTWSPDGGALAFFADARLKRIDLESDAVRDLAAAPNGRGIAWAPDVIVFSPGHQTALQRVPAAGGSVTPFTSIADTVVMSHRMPTLLADGRIAFVQQGTAGTATLLLAQSLAGGPPDTLLRGDELSNAAAAEGHLLYARREVLYAVPFGGRDGGPTGPERAVIRQVERNTFRSTAQYAVIGDALVYRAPSEVRRRLAWFEPATGRVTPIGEPDFFPLPARLALAPDGRTLVVGKREENGEGTRLWLADLETDEWRMLPLPIEREFTVAWTRLGDRIAVQAVGTDSLFILSPDGARVATHTVDPRIQLVHDWTTDGRFGIGQQQSHRTNWDLVIAELSAPAPEVRPLLASPLDEALPLLSPDGRMLAYSTAKSGPLELHVARFPAMDAQRQVAPYGVRHAAWARDGRTLWYVDMDGRLHAVPVAADGVTLGASRLLPGAPPRLQRVATRADGRLLVLTDAEEPRRHLTLVRGWRALLERQ
jgi:serine/threonine-protein kinase